jgi:glutathione S-transferase
MIKVYVFNRLRPMIYGSTRDIRALWALEECGLPYDTVGLDAHNGLPARTPYSEDVNPFNQVPAIDDDGFVLTESGAILSYLAQKAGRLIPQDLRGRMEVERWIYVGLTTLELPIVPIVLYDLAGDQSPYGGVSRDSLVEWLKRRLTVVESVLANQNYLTGSTFTIADLMMTTVLRQLRKSEILRDFPAIGAFRKRCETRPAFQKVLDQYEDRLGAPRGSAR